MNLKHFFWYCSGANVEILEGCKTDHSKYTNIGATIVMTAVLAWISMGFALYSIFKSWPVAIIVGLIWACMIFIMDRTIITSMRKPKNMNVKGQSGESVFGVSKGFGANLGDFVREMAFAFIRLVIAVLISFVITKPLEIKIFEERLAAVIDATKNQKATEANTAIYSNPELNAHQKTINLIQKNKLEVESKIQSKEKTPLYTQLFEDHNACRSSIEQPVRTQQGIIGPNQQKIAGLNSQYDDGTQPPWVVTAIAAAQGKIRSANQQISALQAPCVKIYEGLVAEDKRYQAELQEELDMLKKQEINANRQMLNLQNKANANANVQAENRNRSFGEHIIAQIEALEKLKKEDSSMWWTSTLIMLLFITIEVAPVLAKLLSSRGEYDDAIETHEIKRWLELQTETATRIQAMNIATESAAAKLEKEKHLLKSQQEALEAELQKANESQAELSSKKHAAALEKELASYSELVERISAAQKEIALKQVEIWRNDQLEKLK